MLHAQGVMDLLLELNVRVDFVRHGNGSVKGSESALASQVLHHFVTAWFTKFDGLPTAASVVLNEILRRQRLRGLHGAERRLLGGRANS
jgi:hypothetical protein